MSEQQEQPRDEAGRFAPLDGDGGGGAPAGGDAPSTEPVAIDDLVGGDLREAPVDEPGAGAEVVPDGGAPAAAVDGGVQPDDSPQIVQLEDGGYQLGKFKASSVEELVLEVERSRRAVESKLGLPPGERELAVAPWLSQQAEADDGGGDDGDVVDGDQFAATIGAAVAQQLAPYMAPQQAGAPGPDALQAAMQAVQTADQVTTALASDQVQYLEPDQRQQLEQAVRQSLSAVLTHAPQDHARREQLLQGWGRLNPFEASRTALRIEQAEQSFHAQQAQLQERDQAQRAEAAEREIASAFATGEQSFLERNPEVAQNPQLVQAIDGWFSFGPHAQMAQGARGNAQAVERLFEIAKEQVLAAASASPVVAQQLGLAQQQAPVAHQQPAAGMVPRGYQQQLAPAQQQPVMQQGVVPGWPVVQPGGAVQLAPGVTIPGAGVQGQVSEQGGMMQQGGVYVDPAAVARAQHAQALDLAQLEHTGAGGMGGAFATTPGASEPSLADVIGVDMV